MGYEQLLPLSEVSALLALDDIKIRTKSIDRKDQYGNCYYFWASDRPDVPSRLSVHVQLPDENFVGISGLHAYGAHLSLQDALENFEMGYKQLNDDELSRIEKNMEKHLEDKSDEEKRAVEDLVELRKHTAYGKVNHLGQSAFWKFSTKNGGELVILWGKEQFTVFTKISHDEPENLALAKKLVQTVMDRCQ